ncbi:unnamed protein product [Chironomus riparius]|uniref:Uncharacterized protein n=1 Tax=Chironomus riparius TaxID=315576 RepID=A0A9P0JF08_9DIPT|nr:unnamed protein product [Chironomus riparius]
MIMFNIIVLLFYHVIPSSCYSINPLAPPNNTNRLMTQHITLNCDFSPSQDGHICTARNLNITSRNITIIRVSGEYFNGVGNGNVMNLIVTQQNLRYIPEGISNFFKNLEILTISRSNLMALRFTDFLGLQKLRKIFIVGNHISSIDDQTFKSIPNLEVLDLSSNKIKSIPFEAFSLARHLKILTLSNNLIRIFDILPFPVSSELRELRLNGNQLVRINVASIQHTKMLEFMDLSENLCIDLRYPDDFGDIVGMYTHIVKYCNDDTGVDGSGG